MIRVLVGPTNSGKTETLLARVAEVIATRRRSAHLVVPSAAFAMEMTRSLVEKAGDLPLQGSHPVVTTFPALYYEILEKSKSDRHRLNLIERDRVLRFVLADLARSGKLTYFAEIAAMPGLVNSLASFIEELWRSRTSPESFTRLAESRGDKDRDIAAVFAGYAAALESLAAVDAESAGHLALSILEGDRGPLPWLSILAVDGFDFLTATQVGMLSTLASRGVEVILTLTYEEARAVHYWQRPTVRRLQAAGADFTYRPAEPQGRIQLAAAALMNEERATAFVELNPCKAALHASALEVISAPDRAGEVRAVAGEIKRLAVEQHVSLDEIAVVCRSLAAYSHHIERIFDECSIPFAFDTPLAVLENPAVVALFQLFNLSMLSFPRRACLEAWRSPYFDWTAFGLGGRAIDLLEAISLSENVTGGRDRWRLAVTRFAERSDREQVRTEYDAHDDQSEEGRRARAGQLALDLDRWFDALTPPGRATSEAHFEWASGLVGRLRVDLESGRALAGRDAGAVEEVKAIIAAIAHDRLTGRLVRPVSEPVTAGIDWRAFLSEVERTLSTVTCKRAPVSRPCVMAQEAHRMRPRRYRAVFVLGLLEGEFPARLAERTPYTLAEREALRQAGIDLTETTADAGADLLQFYKAMGRAVERLVLTHARTDIAGGELLPSYLIEEVQPFIVSPPRRIAPSLDCEDQDLTGACSPEELALRTARANRVSGPRGDGQDRTVLRAANRLLDATLPAWRMAERGALVEWQRLRGTPRSRFNGRVVDRGLGDQLAQRFGPEHLWSASQINDYGSCPFRFFARHALKLESCREPGEGFAPHHLGHAYHRILEHLYTRLQKAGERIQSHNADRAVEEAAQLAETVLEQMAERGEVLKDGLWDFNKEEIKRRVGRLLRREAQWNDERPVWPVHCECKFGLEGADPLIIKWTGGEARFCGIVDRIDRTGDGDWVVIDYKTRRTPISLKDATDGRNLQLPIYAMAADRVIGRQAKVASAYYLHIHSRRRGSQVSREEKRGPTIEGLIQQAEERIRLYVTQVRGGEFPVQPNGDMVCLTCEYSVLCRVQTLRAGDDEQDRDE